MRISEVVELDLEALVAFSVELVSGVADVGFNSVVVDMWVGVEVEVIFELAADDRECSCDVLTSTVVASDVDVVDSVEA